MSATSVAVFCLAGLDWCNDPVSCNITKHQLQRLVASIDILTPFHTIFRGGKIETWNVDRNLKKNADRTWQTHCKTINSTQGGDRINKFSQQVFSCHC